MTENKLTAEGGRAVIQKAEGLRGIQTAVTPETGTVCLLRIFNRNVKYILSRKNNTLFSLAYGFDNYSAP